MLTTRLNKNKLFCDPALCEPLEPYVRASVIANENAGMQSPSRTYCHKKRSAEHGNNVQPNKSVQDFVLKLDPDVMPSERHAFLPCVIESYLKASTLCVMVVAVKH